MGGPLWVKTASGDISTNGHRWLVLGPGFKPHVTKTQEAKPRKVSRLPGKMKGQRRDSRAGGAVRGITNVLRLGLPAGDRHTGIFIAQTRPTLKRPAGKRTGHGAEEAKLASRVVVQVKRWIEQVCYVFSTFFMMELRL